MRVGCPPVHCRSTAGHLVALHTLQVVRHSVARSAARPKPLAKTVPAAGSCMQTYTCSLASKHVAACKDQCSCMRMSACASNAGASADAAMDTSTTSAPKITQACRRSLSLQAGNWRASSSPRQVRANASPQWLRVGSVQLSHWSSCCGSTGRYGSCASANALVAEPVCRSCPEMMRVA